MNLEKRYQKLLTEIKVKFKDYELLDLAFVHKSYLNEHKNLKAHHNERLEFLGDAVLELIVTEFLYQNFPEKEEGELTNWRAALVKGEHLAEISQKLELGLFLYLSKGEERSGGRQKNYILANLLEALIGAIYLDRGYNVAKKFIEKHIIAKLDQILQAGGHQDAKSRFQELAQEKRNITPTYQVVSEDGPDHLKSFIVAVYLDKTKIAEGEGTSKQKAEQSAARFALQKMQWV